MIHIKPGGEMGDRILGRKKNHAFHYGKTLFFPLIDTGHVS